MSGLGFEECPLIINFQFADDLHCLFGNAVPPNFEYMTVFTELLELH